MPTFTLQQRAELRDAIARSRIDAENQLAKLRNEHARNARSRNSHREKPVRPQPIAHTRPAPIAPPPPGPVRCVYCGRPSVAYACPSHNDLIIIDIPDGL